MVRAGTKKEADQYNGLSFIANFAMLTDYFAMIFN